jgi:hypothetical protein
MDAIPIFGFQNTLYETFALTLSIASLICIIIVIVDAFQNEIWKGILALFCFLYMLYYLFTEFHHERKNLIAGIILASLVLGFLSPTQMFFQRFTLL